MERRAVTTEREVDALKKAEFMADHVGEEFEGVISSVLKFGFFVELPNTIRRFNSYEYLTTRLFPLF